MTAANEVEVEAPAAIESVRCEDVARLRLMDNPIDSFRSGACLDLRLRFAMDLLTHGSLPLLYSDNPKHARTAAEVNAGESVAMALDLADALFAEGMRRGYVEDLNDERGMKRLDEHVRRSTAFQIEQQRELKRQTEESGRIASAVRGAFGRN